MTRWIPFVTAVIYVGVLFMGSALRFRRRYGRCPILMPRWNDFSLQAMLSRMLFVYFAALLVLGFIAGYAPDRLETLDPLNAHRSPVLQAVGLTLAAAAGLLILGAQREMAASWRIGIDEEPTPLVTQGLFSLCRNPIYLGLQVALIGFVCMIPGYLTLVLLVTAIGLFQAQARLEEDHLRTIHGEEYAAYCRQVGRFLPWIGRGGG